MSERVARNIVRSLIAVALGAALLGTALSPAPDDPPALALGQPGLYRLEIALLVFYGCLALVTPAFSGLASGRLPIEISTRGAKFADEANRTADQGEMTINELEEAVERLEVSLIKATGRIRQLERQRDRK